MSAEFSRPVVPSFGSVAELDFALDQKGTGSGADLYFRDGTKKLAQTEAHLANLVGVNPEQVLLQNNGMTALESALEVGIEKAQTREPVIACAQQVYSKTHALIGRYANRGLKVVRFDSGSSDDVERLFAVHEPDVVLSETVSNGPDIPILDHGHLIKLGREANNEPTLILDNTLPLPTRCKILDCTQSGDNVLVVESGTKAYTLNQEMSGLIYSDNEELLDALRSYRCTTGKMPGAGSIDLIASLLPESSDAFHDRNRKIFRHTGALAVRLFEAQEAGASFIVSHPGLPNHDNFDRTLGELCPNVTPVLYLHSIGQSQAELANQLISHPGVREQAELGQSFGFDKARILHDKTAPVVRIAGGAYTDTQALGDALFEAALTIN